MAGDGVPGTSGSIHLPPHAIGGSRSVYKSGLGQLVFTGEKSQSGVPCKTWDCGLRDGGRSSIQYVKTEEGTLQSHTISRAPGGTVDGAC